MTATTYTANPLLLAALTEDSDFALTRHAGPVIADYRTRILAAVRRILTQGTKEGTVRKLDIEVTAYLLYELGTQLLVKALDGSSQYPLKTTLDVMDSMVANGILTNPKKV